VEAPTRNTGVSKPAVRILVIEDNRDAAESLKEALELGAHEVAIAGDGSSGLELAHQFHPQVVLCDIGLPIIDGYEVARRMRCDPELQSLYLVALSGYASQEDAQHARSVGFDRHMAKPPNMDALEKLLSEVPR
jgi:CheY-like chemotaxis protein